MNIKANIEAVKKILKFVPQQYKKDTLSAAPVQHQKNGKAQKEAPKENLSRNELKDKLRQKIHEIRQKKGKNSNEDFDDDEKPVPTIKKRIRKPKVKAPRREKGPNFRAEKKRARLLNQEKSQDGGKNHQSKKDQRNKEQKKGQNKPQNKGQNKKESE